MPPSPPAHVAAATPPCCWTRAGTRGPRGQARTSSRSSGGHEPPAAALPQSTGRSPAGPVGRPSDSDFEDHTGLEGELGFGLDRIRMALRSFSVNRDNRLCSKQYSGDAARSSTIILPTAVSTECLLRHGTFESGRGQRGVPNGGSRATAAIGDDHAERLALQSVSDLIAEYSRLPRRPADCDDAFISSGSGPHVRSVRP